MTSDPREVWERVASHQRDRWREHVDEHLPSRLLETLGPQPEQDASD